MEDENMAEFFTDSSNYLESLIKSRTLLNDTPMLTKLDEIIALELELALMGAEKAMSEIIKANKSTVTPLKGV